jgi:multiple RNA-binding domain-containing protein 1
VHQVHLVLDKEGNSKGFAYVRYHDPGHAVAAFDAMDGASFQGRLLHILPAVDRQGQKKADDTDPKKRTLKGERAQKRKETSGKDFNWAVLYMNVRFMYHFF